MIWIYRLLIAPAFIAGFHFAALFSRKLRRGVSGRNHAPHQAKTQGAIWFHCASGEFEYAKPVIRELKRRDPHTAIGVLFFSSSVEKSVRSFSLVDDAQFAPWDCMSSVRKFLQSRRPRALLIARTDLWPEMLHQCRRNHIPSLLFSATLSERSSRMKPWARSFSAWLTKMLSGVSCVTLSDAENFKQLAPQLPATVMGDTRFDQVLFRLSQANSLLSRIKPEPVTLVVGSSWPEDEEVLLAAWRQISTEDNNFRLIVAPHEPTEAHLASLARDWPEATRYSEAQNNQWKVLIVDRVGLLADLYTWGQIAFVGGSFRRSVHSVMEPLAAGLPTLVGPYHHNNREAQHFKGVKIFQAPDGESFAAVTEVKNAEQLAQGFLALARHTYLSDMQNHLRGEVQLNAGATARVVDWILNELQR